MFLYRSVFDTIECDIVHGCHSTFSKLKPKENSIKYLRLYYVWVQQEKRIHRNNGCASAPKIKINPKQRKRPWYGHNVWGIEMSKKLRHWDFLYADLVSSLYVYLNSFYPFQCCLPNENEEKGEKKTPVQCVYFIFIRMIH